MNDQKIYELMAKTPNIRAVQICDALDAELTDVSAALRALVDVGDVVKHSDFGPNGRQAQVYNLSEDFKKSRDGKALLARIAAASTPAATGAGEPAAAEPVAAPVPTSKPVDAERVVNGLLAAATPGRKPDRAIAHLEAHGTATDDELRTVMGVRKPYAPSAYLAAAMKAGKLYKANGVWRLGRAPTLATNPEPQPATGSDPAEEAPDAKASPIKQLKTAIAEFAAGSAAADRPAAAAQGTAQVALAAVCQVHTPATEAEPAARYRCALWSDGVLEVRKDGETVAEMPQAAGESLAAFLARLTQQKEAA